MGDYQAIGEGVFNFIKWILVIAAIGMTGFSAFLWYIVIQFFKK